MPPKRQAPWPQVAKESQPSSIIDVLDWQADTAVPKPATTQESAEASSSNKPAMVDATAAAAAYHPAYKRLRTMATSYKSYGGLSFEETQKDHDDGKPRDFWRAYSPMEPAVVTKTEVVTNCPETQLDDDR
jgi:hypothetical protein